LSGGESIHIWGAQLEESSTVGQYVKTTTAKNGAPRFDHDPTTGESLGLLVEESRTNLITNSGDVAAYYTEQNSTPTADAAVSPDGTTTATLLVPNTSNSTHASFNSSVSFSASTTYSYSLFVKPNGYTFIQLVFTSGFGNNSAWVNFNLTGSGSSGFTGGGEIDSQIQAYPDGWYRCTIVATSGSSPSGGGPVYAVLDSDRNSRDPNYAGNGTDGAYLWGAQIEAGSFPTSYIPTEGSTVTRAADVTSITGRNFGSVNLLQYSEEFDQAGWTNAGTFTWTPSTDLAPDGSLTVDKPSVVFTYWGFYDVTNVAWLSGYPAAFPFTVTSSWTRQSVTITAPAGCTSLRFYPGRVGGAGSYLYQTVTVTPGTTYTASAYYKLDSASSTVLVWGAQLEEGSTATDYIKSDVNFTSRGSTATYYDVNGVIQTAAIDEARTAAYLPDGNGNFVSAGDLLLEGAGTNLLTYSEEFDDPSYSYSTRLAVDPNTAVAPNGTFTADKIIGTSNNDQKYAQFSANVVSGFQYVFSLYAKKDEYEVLQLQAANTKFTGTLPYANFDLANGSLGSFADCLSIIEPAGNGWYRCSIVLSAATSSGSNPFRFSPYASGDPARLASYAGDGTSGIYLWGAQLEQNSYATSYIPTSGSTATRAADVSTSAATFGNSWYEQSEGTVYHLYNPFGVGSSRFYSFNDGTNNNQILGAASNGSGSASNYIEITAASVNQSFLGASGAYSPTLQTGALAYIVNNCAYSKNGGAVFVDTSVTIPIINTLNLGSDHSNSSILNGTIRRLTYWPTRLSNDTLQTITV
jgi:hypothetical protein